MLIELTCQKKKNSLFHFRQPPLFLNRNLTYVNFRKCRTKRAKRRSSGKFNTFHSIVDKLAEQKRGAKHYMTLTLFGFHCDELMNHRHAEVLVFHKQTKTKVIDLFYMQLKAIDFRLKRKKKTSLNLIINRVDFLSSKRRRKRNDDDV